MEENKKSGGRGCEGFRPIVGRRVGKSQKCVFRLFPSRAHGGSLCAPLTSLAARRKSRFAEKKSAPPKKNCACRKKWRIVCIKGGMSLPVVTCHNRPSEDHRFGCGFLQAALQASPFACMEKSTIRHLRWRVCPSRQFDKFVTWAGW